MTYQFYIPDDVKKTLHSRKRNLEPGEEDRLICPEGCTIDHTNEKTINTFKKVIGDLVCLKSELKKMNYLVGETDFTECMDRRIMTILYDVREEIDRLEKQKESKNND